jgi:outer membrane protein OmpA-like peptidoglycan-associated protein
MNAQSEKVETVYFDFDKYGLDSEQQQTILDFIAKADTSKIESVQIYGCDDRGNADYNYKLSEERVSTVRNLLTANGFKKKTKIIIEGKGRVILTDDFLENLGEIRSKNRRVDLVLVQKNSFGEGIYNSFRIKHTIGIAFT